MREGSGAGFADGRDDARGGVEDEEAVGEGDDDGGGDGAEGGHDKVEGCVEDRGEGGKRLDEGGI